MLQSYVTVKLTVAVLFTVKKFVMSGKAPVDPECTSLVNKAHVYYEGKDVYDCMLNQVSLLTILQSFVLSVSCQSANKFSVIFLLHLAHSSSNQFW